MQPNYRRCISCRQVAPKSEFWRIVRVYPDHRVQLDEGMGRSVYLCPQTDCLKTAQKKNRLAKVLRAKVPDPVYQTLWERLETQEGTLLKEQSEDTGELLSIADAQIPPA
ncbi:MAG: YlxR family protein [Acaryochloris sp. RU_4_1]|nr:YlxR family protein [Acaryochloris sp. SU_5_25]NJM65488.1 YlxR family protein [Acaryochloris sp. RU_4_1]